MKTVSPHDLMPAPEYNIPWSVVEWEETNKELNKLLIDLNGKDDGKEAILNYLQVKYGHEKGKICYGRICGLVQFFMNYKDDKEFGPLMDSKNPRGAGFDVKLITVLLTIPFGENEYFSKTDVKEAFRMYIKLTSARVSQANPRWARFLEGLESISKVVDFNKFTTEQLYQLLLALSIINLYNIEIAKHLQQSIRIILFKRELHLMHEN